MSYLYFWFKMELYLARMRLWFIFICSGILICSGCRTPVDEPGLVHMPGSMPLESPDRPEEEPGDIPFTAPPPQTNIAEFFSGEPRIQPGHVLTVTVISQGKREFEETAKRVSATGSITLPLIGLAHVEGLTMTELVDVLHERYAEFIHDPMIDVSFMIDSSPGAVSPWGTVTILGRVNQPGRISIPPTQDLTLSMAVQLAGGLDTSARDTSIRISRRNPDTGAMEVMDVNLRAAASDGQIENDILLQAGDVIYVPQRVF